MCSADFTRVNGSTIQIVSLANYLKGLTFLILNANFQETASLSIVLSFFIHISYYDIQVEMVLTLHASLLRRCRRILYNFYFQVQFWTLFDTQLINFMWKYVLLFVLDIQYEKIQRVATVENDDPISS